MNELKHTPGPWSVTEQDDAFFVINPFEMLVAEAYDGADARIIAAAPGLLSALKLILTAEERGFGIDYIKGCARATIAKVEGEAYE